MGKAGPRPIDISGKRYGRLIVLSFAGSSASGALWLCRCDCGTEVIRRGANLRQYPTRQSCGCQRREKRASVTTHGHTVGGMTPTYRSWQAMKERCQNPNRNVYAHYGGRGITVCDRWQRFDDFLADMGERPPGTSIDRIDNDGNYEPGNCRWATETEQKRNTRVSYPPEVRARALQLAGESTPTKAARQLNIPDTTVMSWVRAAKTEAKP